MKLYTGERTPNALTVLVRTTRPDLVDRYELPHIKRHSPDGFEWGFEGSGPLDLAYAILHDFGSAGLANAAYRPLCSKVVAAFDRKVWSLSASQVADFLVETALGTLTTSTIDIDKAPDGELMAYLGFDTHDAYYRYGIWADSQAELGLLLADSSLRTWLELEASALLAMEAE